MTRRRVSSRSSREWRRWRKRKQEREESAGNSTETPEGRDQTSTCAAKDDHGDLSAARKRPRTGPPKGQRRSLLEEDPITSTVQPLIGPHLSAFNLADYLDKRIDPQMLLDTEITSDCDHMWKRVVVIPYFASPDSSQHKHDFSSARKRSKELSRNAHSSDSAGNGGMVNPYKRNRTVRDNSASAPTSSLSDLVDSVIWSLVHRRYRLRMQSRCKRRKKSTSVRSDYSNYLGNNVLALGYDLSSETLATWENTKPPPKFKRGETLGQDLHQAVPRDLSQHGNSAACASFRASSTSLMSHCPNMPPGVRCTHPNACASYARSAPLVKTIHRLLGDDLLRQLLLTCIILIPTRTSGSTAFDQTARHSANELLPACPRAVQGHNFFQLCGPPLTHLCAYASMAKNPIQGDVARCTLSRSLSSAHGTPPDSRPTELPKKRQWRCGNEKASRTENVTKTSKRTKSTCQTDLSQVLPSFNLPVSETGKRSSFLHGMKHQQLNDTTQGTTKEAMISSRPVAECGYPSDASDIVPEERTQDEMSTDQSFADCKEKTDLPKERETNAHVNKPSANEGEMCDGRKGCQWQPNAPLPRRCIFYSDSFVKAAGLPLSHILNRRDIESPRATKELLDVIFNLGILSDQRKKAPKRSRLWKRLQREGADMCRSICKRHQRCDYNRLLERHCPLPYLLKGSDGLKRKKRNREGYPPSEHRPTTRDLLGKGGYGDGASQGNCDSARAHTTNHVNGQRPQNLSRGPGSPTPLMLSELVIHHTPPSDVHAFLVDVLKQVFPSSFWGSFHNFRVVTETLRDFLLLRRNEQMPQKTILKGVRVTDFFWLRKGGGSQPEAFTSTRRDGKQSRSDHETSTMLVRKLLSWLYRQFVFPLLRALFYITESEFAWNRVLYYRKPLWTKIRAQGIKELAVNRNQYRELRDSVAIDRISRQALGCHRLRLLPKTSGIRAIAVFSKRGLVGCTKSHINRAPHQMEPQGIAAAILRMMEHQQCPANVLLGQTFDVLKHEQESVPARFGSGLWGIHEVYPRLKKFVKEIKMSKGKISSTPLYFTSVDIHRCFDTINQKELYNLAEDIISNDDYLIQKFSAVHPFPSSNGMQLKVFTRVNTPENYIQFPEFAETDLSSRYSNAVFVDSVKCSVAKKEALLSLLKEHLFRNLVTINGNFEARVFEQSNGIPQGSVLSPLLCNFYYGHLERQLLDGVFFASETRQRDAQNTEVPPAPRGDGFHLLIRIVDDFLMVSTELETSQRFLAMMRKGIPSQGVRISSAKTRTTYCDGGVQCESEISQTQDGEKSQSSREEDPKFFPWCGMLLDVQTCEVRVDYSRFEGDASRDALTVDRMGSEGSCLKKRMLGFIRPRCQPIFFDSEINSNQVIMINFHQAHLFCAVKTVNYVSGMHGGAQSNPSFVLQCVESVIGFSHKMISLLLAKGDQISFPFLSQSCTKWLGWHAHWVVYSQVPEFREVSRRLRSKMRRRSNCSKLGRGTLSTAEQSLKEFGISRFYIQTGRRSCALSLT